MIASSFHLLLPFSLLLLLLHGALGGDIVNQTCKTIADGDPNVTFDFCVATLQAVPESHSASLDKLGVIAMNLTKCNATQTMAFAKKLMKQKWKTHHTRSCLKDCVELYSDAISSLKVAMDDVKIESYFEANIHISATMDAPMTCEDGFKEKKGTESPLSNRNKDMFQLSAIALSIINMLAQDQV